MKKVTYLLLLMLISVFQLSCEKSAIDGDTNIPTKDYSAMSNVELFNSIKVENGYLSFNSEIMLGEVTKRLAKMSPVERENFEHRLNFKSLFSLTNAEMEEYAKNPDQSKQYKHISIAKGLPNPSFPLLERSLLLNSEGYMKVGDYVEVFTNTKYVRLKNGNIADAQQALVAEDGDYANFFVSTIHRLSNQSPVSVPNARLKDGTGTFTSASSILYPNGGPTNSPLPHYYLLYMDYAWYITGMAPNDPSGRFIRYEITTYAGCGYSGYNGVLYTNQTLNPLNGSITIYSGFGNVGNYSNSFNNNGYSYNGQTTFTILSGNNLITNGSFHGVFTASATLSSADGNVISFSNRVVNF